MIESQQEEWRPIAGYEGLYEVSSLGTVRSVDRSQPHGIGGLVRVLRGRVIAPWINCKGYKHVALSLGGVVSKFRIHTLVFEAFNPGAERECINHKNGNKLDNRAANLEASTYGENNAHAYRTGLKSPVVNRGMKSGTAKFTDADVRAIRARYASGVSSQVIADERAVVRSTICRIIARTTWSHIC